MEILLDVTVAIFGLSILIVAHESGHYFVARAFDMKVLRYSIGIGPSLLRYQPKGSPTTFQICAIPFLAYVQIAGMNPHEEYDPDDPGVFQNKSLFGRVATVAAGPLANYLTAVVLIFPLSLWGWPGPERMPMEIAEIAAHSPALRAGLEIDDRIIGAAGQPVESTVDLIDISENRIGQPTEYVLLRNGAQKSLTMTPAMRVDFFLGFAIDSFNEAQVPQIGSVADDTPAAEAGFRQGDVLVSMDGKPVTTMASVAKILEQEGPPRSVEVRRGHGRASTLTFPEGLAGRYFKEKAFLVRGVVGVTGSTAPMTLEDSAYFAFAYPAMIISQSFAGLGEMVTDFDPDALAGPVRLGMFMADSAGGGAAYYVQTLIILSVALGFFNLLPFPALDGGRLVFLAYEVITQKQANEYVEAWVHVVGNVFLLLVVALVTLRDLQELFG